MSYDALVWLLVGLGAGVGGSLLLLIGYAALERGRLGRRLRRARALSAAASEPVRPVVAKAAAQPEATKPHALEAKPAPVKPALAVVATATLEPVVAAKPVSAPAPTAVPTTMSAAPQRPQSVEAMFAEAFANDRLTALPEPDEDAAPPNG